RSPDPQLSWVTSAGCVLDAASFINSTIDTTWQPMASLCVRSGFLSLRAVAEFFGIEFDSDPQPDDPISISRQEWDEVCDRLAGAGVPLKADRDQAWRDWSGWRVNYDAVLVGLAGLTVAPYAQWSSDRSLRWRGR